MAEPTTKVVTQEMIKEAAAMLRQEHAERLRLEKVAGELELEKRAQKIAFREVELGVTEPFKSHEEFQEKVASLLNDGDLDVVEKALDRGYAGVRKGGELDAGAGGPKLNELEDWVRNGVVPV